MLKARYRHILRFREIGRILTKHGLGQLLDLVSRPNGEKGSRGRRVVTLAVRLRVALEQLGPTFVKLGQLISTRPDLIPLPFIEEMEKLQDKVMPVPIAEISRVLEAELGPEYRQMFANIEEQPLASASIGQVHKATLHNGKEVVIKVQRPGIRKLVTTDLEIFLESARLFQRKTKWGAFYRVGEMAEEFSNSILEELDYTNEGFNCEKLGELFSQDDTVRFPRVYWEYSTPKVLTLEYADGIKINSISALNLAGIDTALIAHNLANAIFRQIYIYGFFHADPHPGNLAVTNDQRIFFMDFGLVGRISEDLRDKLATLALAIVRHDITGMAEGLIDISDAADTVDLVKLGKDLERLMAKYYGLPIDKLNLGELLQEMLKMAYEYQIRVPPEVILLVKTLVTVEGVVTQLDSTLSILDLAQPFGKELLKEKFSPPRLKKQILSGIGQIASLVTSLPRRTDLLLTLVERGRLRVQFENRDMKQYVSSVTGALDRLAISIVVGAIILGSSLLNAKNSSLFIWRYPLAEIGLFSGITLGCWLLIFILRSTHR